MDSALCLYMLATNLGCVTVATWCIEYLKHRICRDNVVDIWLIGIATRNTDMLGICVPVIADHFESVESLLPSRYSLSELEILATVLGDSQLTGVSVCWKLRAI
uniref:Secreted protein n=1 Tax=Mesocestoides corti TaxID=53468 RepID=A0A5K3G0S0_MESCO